MMSKHYFTSLFFFFKQLRNADRKKNSKKKKKQLLNGCKCERTANRLRAKGFLNLKLKTDLPRADGTVTNSNEYSGKVSYQIGEKRPFLHF